MNAAIKPCFYDICTIHAFNSQKLQRLATLSGVSMSTIEAMCDGTAVMRFDAEKVLTVFSQLTRCKWTLNNVNVLVLPTFADLFVALGFDAASLSVDADVPFATVDQMLCNCPVPRDDAVKVLQTLSSRTGHDYTLENVVVQLIDLQQADLHVEEVYNLIKSHKGGVVLETLAKQYAPKDPSVPYVVARLLADGRVKSEQRGGKVYCVAVELGALDSRKK